MLLKTVEARKIDPRTLITHWFTLADIMNAYDTFGSASRAKALKVIINA